MLPLNRIVVISPAIDARPFKRKDGNAGVIRSQTAWLYECDSAGIEKPFPVELKVTLSDDHAGYAPGDYCMHPSSLTVGPDFKRPAIGRFTLVPFPVLDAA